MSRNQEAARIGAETTGKRAVSRTVVEVSWAAKRTSGGNVERRRSAMRQAVYHGIRDVRLEDVPEPEIGPGQAKVRVRYCGICGSDVHEYLHGPFPLSPFGHEVCGEIVEVGAEVEGFEPGDHVAVVSPGGYAELMAAPRERMMKLPEELSWRRAALIEPLSVAAYGITRSGVKPGDTVLVCGAGPIGLMLLLGLGAVGVDTVYVSEPMNNRRDLAERLGATEVLDPGETKVSAAVRELTGGRGVDVSFEAVGIEASLKDCLASTRFGGTVLVEGIFTEKVPVHMLGFVTRETTMIGANLADPPLALEWILNRGLEPEAIVTGVVSLEDIVGRGFEELTSPHTEQIKVLVEPGG
jgi:(R,R)-butanediol dehydrogenase/meso-butanediol dehydrogenase/diacetyl reductase